MTIPKTTFNTTDLKLAALILAEIEDASFQILHSEPFEIKKTIRILAPTHLKDQLDILVAGFINRKARVHVFRYNRYLNSLRDRLKEDEDDRRRPQVYSASK